MLPRYVSLARAVIISGALLLSSALALPASAQSTNLAAGETPTSSRLVLTPSSGLVLDVASPAFEAPRGGNITFYGVAANCTADTGADRVAVFDGTDPN